MNDKNTFPEQEAPGKNTDNAFIQVGEMQMKLKQELRKKKNLHLWRNARNSKRTEQKNFIKQKRSVGKPKPTLLFICTTTLNW
jgi:hypothetical protein